MDGPSGEVMPNHPDAAAPPQAGQPAPWTPPDAAVAAEPAAPPPMPVGPPTPAAWPPPMPAAPPPTPAGPPPMPAGPGPRIAPEFFAPPPPPRASRLRPPWRASWLVAGAAVVAVIGLVSALLVWAPWSPPSVPQRLAVRSSSPTENTLTWSPPSEGTSVADYLVQRDDAQVATVPGSQRSYQDKGLIPGGKHSYRVIAARGSKHSVATAPIMVATPAPSPTGLVQQASDPTSVTLAWSPPTGSPAPDQYLLLVDGQTSDISGAPSSGAPSQRLVGLHPATAYSVQVEAVWAGGGISAPSEALSITTANPPLSEARLEASGVPVSFSVTASNASDVAVGRSWTSSWTLTPACASGPCSVSLEADFHPSGNGRLFDVALTRSGNTYTGTARASISNCRGKSVTDTITVTLTVTAASGPDWVATGWTGRIEYVNPYTNAGGGYYCPSGRTAATVTAAPAST